MKLFDGSDSESENDEPKIEIDKEFARRYEHNKKREDLQRFDELKKKGVIRGSGGGEDSEGSSESSSEEEEDDGVVSGRSKKKDLKFFEALIKVRKQDPSLKSKDVALFDSESDSDDNDDGKDSEEKGKKKAVYLKDVVARHLIEEGPDFGGDEEENGYDDEKTKRLVYNEEQEMIRNEFLKAAEEEEDDEGELLRVKARNEGDESEDEELKKKVDEYFGDESDENARFLKEYFVNKMWVDKRSGGEYEDDLELLSEDEEAVEKQEEFEYRYQENAGDRVLGHSREVEGTVRKKEKARKEQRKHKEERMAAAKMERDEELRHLKNLKKKEMEERVRRIMEIAGIGADEVVPLTAKELEEEFDPEEYDRMMKKAFGGEYYNVEVDPEADSDDDSDEAGKPNFDEEDELLGLDKGWDGRNTGGQGLRNLEHEVENEGEEEEEEEEEEKEGKRKRKRKSAILEKAKEAMLEEYFKLDYEDTIGDLRTRFKYAKTKSNRFGLSTAEMLMMDDKELGQYVSMKKIAPYTDKEWRVPNSKRYEIKMKAQELLRSKRPSKLERKKNKKKVVYGDDKPSSSHGKASPTPTTQEASTGEPSNVSKTARRRQKRAELKLSQSRLMAYGKGASKPKKAKH